MTLDRNELRRLADNRQVSDDNRITTLTVGELRATLQPLLDENDRLREALKGLLSEAITPLHGTDSKGRSCSFMEAAIAAARAALESSGGSGDD